MSNKKHFTYIDVAMAWAAGRSEQSARVLSAFSGYCPADATSVAKDTDSGIPTATDDNSIGVEVAVSIVRPYAPHLADDCKPTFH